MSSQKDRELMNSLDRCFALVQQSSTKGISAIEIAKKLGKHRTTIHSYLNTLDYTGRVENRNGIWYPKTGMQTIKPLEKEIIIELPMPKNRWLDVANLEIHAKSIENLFPEVAEINRTIIEKFNETRTIRIRGKNVDALDIEKLGNLIQQANEKSSKFNLRGLFKKRPRVDSEKPLPDKTGKKGSGIAPDSPL